MPFVVAALQKQRGFLFSMKPDWIMAPGLGDKQVEVVDLLDPMSFQECIY